MYSLGSNKINFHNRKGDFQALQNINLKLPNSRFCGERNAHDGEFFILLPFLNAVPIYIVPGYFAYIVQVERIGIIAK